MESMMRALTMLEMDAVAGSTAGYDSTDYVSETGVNVPIEDHGAYVQAQAQAAAMSLWAQQNALVRVDRDLNGNGTIDETSYYLLDGSFVRCTITSEGHSFWDAIYGIPEENTSGYFVCVGGGEYVVGGLCGATNPYDLYAYGGVGVGTALSVNAGTTTDTQNYLTGWGAGFTTPWTGAGFGSTLNGQTQAGLVGTPGASVTYGVSVSDTFRSMMEAIADGRAAADEAARRAAQEFIDHYYPDPLLPDPITGQ